MRSTLFSLVVQLWNLLKIKSLSGVTNCIIISNRNQYNVDSRIATVLFFNKIANLVLQLYWTKDSTTGAFQWNWQVFQNSFLTEHLRSTVFIKFCVSLKPLSNLIQILITLIKSTVTKSKLKENYYMILR